MVNEKLRIAFDELLREKNSGVNIFLEAISLLLIGIVFFLQALNGYNKNEVDKILKYGVKDTGIVAINSYEELEKLDIFEEKMKYINGVEQVGYGDIGIIESTEYKGDFLEKIYEMQEGHQEICFNWDENEWGKNVETAMITVGSEDFFDFKIDEGYSFKTCEKLLEEYEEVIYLGSKLKGFEKGTVLYNKDNQKVIIGGYINEDLKMVKSEISGESIAYFEMDYKILRIMKKRVGYTMFAISKGANMREVKEKIFELAQEYNVDINVKTYEGIFDGIESRNRTIISFLDRILIVVLITVVLLQICMQSVHIIDNMKNYGILYANGFSMSDHFLIFSIQSIIKGFLATFLSLGAGYLIIDWYYTDMIYSLDILYSVLLRYVSWKVITCAIVIAAFTAIISITIFSRKTPKELVQEG